MSRCPECAQTAHRGGSRDVDCLACYCIFSLAGAGEPTLAVYHMRSAAIDLPIAGMSPDAVAAQLTEALSTAVVVHVRPLEQPADPLPYWEDVISRMGEFAHIAEDPSGKKLDANSIWMDVRFDPRYDQSFRHFNTAQPLHTDGAYEDHSPEIAFFYCARQAAAGGATLFLDVEDLVAAIRREDPQLYEQLTTTPVRFSKQAVGKTCCILDADERGFRVNWNYYRVAADQPPEIQQLRERFHQLLGSRFVDGEEVMPLRLETGESVFFRDRRVLHGRRAYEAKAAGDRLIWKCYISRPRDSSAGSSAAPIEATANHRA